VNYVVEFEGGERWEVSIDPGEPSQVKLDGAAHAVDMGSVRDGTLIARVDGRMQLVRLTFEDGGLVVETQDGRKRKARVESASADAWRRRVTEQAKAPRVEGPTQLRAPIAGSIAELMVPEGARVDSGQPVLKLEAMKMLNSIGAPGSGIIRFAVQKGETVLTGALLARIGTESET
jgi:glutaconyl-CoA/methylmalonyl-CoA decarboxylase subunit gamma